MEHYNPTITVRTGRIDINSIAIVQATPTCVMLSIDLNSKYVDVLGTGSGSNDVVSVWLDYNERTLHLKDEAESDGHGALIELSHLPDPPNAKVTRTIRGEAKEISSGTWVCTTATGRYEVFVTWVWYPFLDGDGQQAEYPHQWRPAPDLKLVEPEEAGPAPLDTEAEPDSTAAVQGAWELLQELLDEDHPGAEDLLATMENYVPVWLPEAPESKKPAKYEGDNRQEIPEAYQFASDEPWPPAA